MTGTGECIMVLLSAKRLCDLVADEKQLDAAARLVMAEIEAIVPASAGFISIDVSGKIVVLWDTPFMAYARRSDK